jgi:hypothetical protein
MYSYDANGRLNVNSVLESGDIQLGAVEIKNSTDDTRATVGANGLHVDVRNIQAGTNLLGKVGIDQVTANANEVVVKSALPAGTNAIGKLAANSGVDIGDVDVTSLPTLPAGTNVIGKTGYKLVKVSTSVTRPSDTTQYAVGDAVTNSTSSPAVFELDLGTAGAVAAQAIEIRKLAVVSSAKQSVLPFLNVFLSNATFTATNDNSALDIADATQEAGGAWINCDIQNYTASNSRVAYLGAAQPMVLAAADTKLYGTLQSANTYTPVSGEKFTVIAWIALL